MPLLRFIHPWFKQHAWVEYFVFFLFAVAVLGFYSLIRPGSSASSPPPAAYSPIRILNLEVRPSVVHPGETATLLNGICNDTLFPIGIQIYLGAQKDSADPILIGQTIDLIGKDTPEGRARRTIDPGCTSQEPIVSVVPASFTPGRWKLQAHVIVTGPAGEMQNLLVTSATFWVVPVE